MGNPRNGFLLIDAIDAGTIIYLQSIVSIRFNVTTPQFISVWKKNDIKSISVFYNAQNLNKVNLAKG